MFLETTRLILREFREEDFPDYCAYAMDAEMCRMMGQDLLDTEEAARENFDWLKNREDRIYGKEDLCYVLVLRETGRVIGNLNITPVPDCLLDLPALAGKTGKGLSFCISRQYQRRGLMTEALRAVIARLFNQEGVDYISCGYFDFNTPSKALQEKLGFTTLTTGEMDYNGERFATVEQVLYPTDFSRMQTL